MVIDSTMEHTPRALPIITADQRLAEPRRVKRATLHLMRGEAG